MLTHAGKYYNSLLGEANIVATVRHFSLMQNLLMIFLPLPKELFKC